MADNLETSEIVVQDGQGNNQLVQAVSNLNGSIIWTNGMQDAWCVVQDEQGNKQLALKTVVIDGGSGDITEDKIIIKADTIPTASSSNYKKMYIYSGATNETYTHGYIYENQADIVYSGTITFNPAEISITDENYANFINDSVSQGKISNAENITHGTMFYHYASGIWVFTALDADDNELGKRQIYQSDYENYGFVFSETYSEDTTINFATTIEEESATYQWVRIDVQPNGLPNVVSDTTSTSITLQEAKANTIYKYGTLSSLTITANETSDEEILIYFTSGATCTVSFPNTLQWVNEDELSPDSNTKYVISIINNIAAYGSYN